MPEKVSRGRLNEEAKKRRFAAIEKHGWNNIPAAAKEVGITPIALNSWLRDTSAVRNWFKNLIETTPPKATAKKDAVKKREERRGNPGIPEWERTARLFALEQLGGNVPAAAKRVGLKKHGMYPWVSKDPRAQEILRRKRTRRVR